MQYIMKITKKTISNILFYGLIIFALTPYGRPKFIQAISYVKSFIMPTSVPDVSKRIPISNMDVALKGMVNAQDLNLNDLKGKVVFLNYWATWCPPCRAEMPSIQKLYNEYQDKMVFVFITSDPIEKVTAYYSENKFNLPTYKLQSNPAPEINTNTLPTTFIIDKKGRLVAKEVGASIWNSASNKKMFDTLLAE